jgi:hypothetical protein
VRHPFQGPDGPGIYWDNNKDGVVDFAAFSYEGDNAVDGVFVNDSRGALTWVAHCSPRETAWSYYPRWAQEHSQPQPQPQQPQPQSPPAAPTGNINDLLHILGQTTSDNPWVSSVPAPGAVEQNYGQCGYSPSIYDTCVTYSPTDPTVL